MKHYMFKTSNHVEICKFMFKICKNTCFDLLWYSEWEKSSIYDKKPLIHKLSMYGAECAPPRLSEHHKMPEFSFTPKTNTNIIQRWNLLERSSWKLQALHLNNAQIKCSDFYQRFQSEYSPQRLSTKMNDTGLPLMCSPRGTLHQGNSARRGRLSEKGEEGGRPRWGESNCSS
jgi:hypothetical protein